VLPADHEHVTDREPDEIERHVDLPPLEEGPIHSSAIWYRRNSATA
jgi:hypothetical protein